MTNIENNHNEMSKKPVFIHGYRLELTCRACDLQYDIDTGRMNEMKLEPL